MKRFFILLMILAVFLGGCKKNAAPAKDPAEPYQIEGERFVFYRNRQGTVPLSYTKDGVQQIEPGSYWFYQLSGIEDRAGNDPYYIYDPEKLDLTGKKEYRALGRKAGFATNGNWPLFIKPVHTEYSAATQQAVADNLKEAVAEELRKNALQAEPLITDVWTMDMNGDGKEETLFKAAREGAEGEEIGGYIMLGYAEDANTVIFYTCFPKEGPQPALEPILWDPEGDRSWSLLLLKRADYDSFTAFTYKQGSFEPQYEIIF